jgi:hypothetical protein
MSGRATPLAPNPFPETLPDLGSHTDDCVGPEHQTGYIEFANRPEIPDVTGGVVLIGGRPNLGKSVFSHRCLHHYKDRGCLDIDLSEEPSGDLSGPASTLPAIISRLRSDGSLSAKASAGLRDIGAGSAVEGHRALGGALGARRLVVRLPPPDPNLRPAAIARQVGAYARAANAANSSVYLFEFPFWVERDWRSVLEEVGRGKYAKLVTYRELEPFSNHELLTFLLAHLGGQDRLDAVFEVELDRLLKGLRRQRASLSPNNLTWFNMFCRHAFETAIEDGAAKVATYHFVTAAVRSGAP